MQGSARAVVMGGVLASIVGLLLSAPATAQESELSPPSIISVTPGASATVLDVV
jgi:hypothetical protein